MAVRRLTGADTDRFRAVRLEGLERHPTAFGASFEQEAAAEHGFFVNRLETSAVFGGFIDGATLQGIAGFYAHGPGKESHTGYLYGMYVREEARGTGLAQALIDAVLAHAAEEVETIKLTVELTNEAARRLYLRNGFACYGIDRRSLCIDGVYYDEALMAKRLR